MDKCMSLLSIQGLGWLLITLRWHFSNGCRTAISPTWTCSTSRRLSGCLQQPGVNCSSNYWLNDKTCEIERDIWIHKAAIRGWQTHRRFFHPYCLLALQAEAFLAIIIKRNVEDKKREKKKKRSALGIIFPSAFKSDRPIMQCMEFMRWSSLMAWMSVVCCNVFYGNDASPLPGTTKPPSAVRLLPLIVDGSIKEWGEKIYPPPPTDHSEA